jgi:outer membrane protein assembly factor BamB
MGAGGHVYLVDHSGIAECLELEIGKWVTSRLKGSGENSRVWPSLVLNNNKIYVANKSGDVFVSKTAPQFELLARSASGEETNSSVVVSEGDFFYAHTRHFGASAKTRHTGDTEDIA